MTELHLEIDCHDVQQLRDEKADFLLIDCRESEEHALGIIEGAQLLPLSELEQRWQELADQQQKHIVVYCHHGMRSARAANWLRQQGFHQTQSMAGGIDRWSEELDATLPRY